VYSGRCKHLFQLCNGVESTSASQWPISLMHLGPKRQGIGGLNITFQNYSDYLQNRTISRIQFCGQFCRPPRNETTIRSLAKFWSGWMFDGTMFIIFILYFTSISHFMATEFNEMTVKLGFLVIRTLYWVHVVNSLDSFAIYSSSQTAIRPSNPSWGHNEANSAIAHYVLGWISHAHFTASLIADGYRYISVIRRKMVMTAYSIFGFADYFIYCEKII